MAHKSKKKPSSKKKTNDNPFVRKKGAGDQASIPKSKSTKYRGPRTHGGGDGEP